jgi:hypothetical protein
MAMAEELKEKEIKNKTAESSSASSEKPTDAPSAKLSGVRERLSKLVSGLSKAEKDAGARKAQRERSLLEEEKRREREREEAKQKIEENNHRAKDAALIKTAAAEYSGEYRQRLAKQEKKKKKELEEKEQAFRIDAERERDAARLAEIEEFLRREKEENEKRLKLTERILGEITDKSGENRDVADKETELATEIKADVPTPVSETEMLLEGEPIANGEPESKDKPRSTNELQFENEISEEIQASEQNTEKPNGEKSDTPPTEQAEKERIIITVNPPKANGSTEDEGNILHIGARNIGFIPPPPKKENIYLHITPTGGAYTSEVSDERRPVSEPRAAEYENELYRDNLLYEEERRGSEELLNLQEERGELLLHENAALYDENLSSSYEEQYSRELELEKEYAGSEFEAEELNLAEKYDEALLYGLSEDELDPKLAEELELEGFSGEPFGHFSEEAAAYAKAELSKRLDDCYRSVRGLTEKIRKTQAMQGRAAFEENIALIVEKISLQKEIVELMEEALASSVYAAVRREISRHRKLLLQNITIYNSFCKEYEGATGRQLTRISESVAEDIMAGKIPEPIPNVYYYGEGAGEDKGEELLTDEYISEILERDYPESLTGSERRRRERQQNERMEAVKRASERDLLIIGLRFEHKMSELEAERDILLNSFTAEPKKQEKRLRIIDKKIAKLSNGMKRALRLEREANSRYYYLLAVEPGDERVRKSARRERLDALKNRLEILLREREELNERLIILYGGSTKKLKQAKVLRKAGEIRKKHARSMYKKQRILADRISAIRAPIDMKEKAFALLNKRTAAVAKIEECRYKLAKLKPQGRARRELVTDIKKAKAAIRYTDADVKFIMKKMRKHEQRYIDDRNWGIMLAVVALLAIVGFAVFYIYGDSIMAYFHNILKGFRGEA